MDATCADENNKPEVGSFVASADTSSLGNNEGVSQVTLDERLVALSRANEDSKLEIHKEEMDPQQSVTLPLEENQFQPQREISEEAAHESSGNPNVLTSIPEAPIESLDTYHTISGRPETLRETVQRSPMVSASITPEEKRYPLQVNQLALEKRGRSLFAVVLNFFFVLDCIVFLICFKMSSIITFLVEGQYITRGENGLYSYGQIIIPKLVTDNALYIAIGLTGVSLVALLVAGAIDIVSGKTAGLLLKTLFFIMVCGLIGWGVFYLYQNDFNIPLIINNLLAS